MMRRSGFLNGQRPTVLSPSVGDIISEVSLKLEEVCLWSGEIYIAAFL